MILDNPYLDIFKKAQSYRYSWDMKQALGVLREDLCMKYSWAVPDDEALQTIKEFVPDRILEVGAGNGYWAYMLSQLDVDILATDIKPYKNDWLDGTKWFNVHHLTALDAVMQENLDTPYTLMTVWPYMDEMAYDALMAYEGQRVIYVGEGQGGCTANSDFFEALDDLWTQVLMAHIPQWRGSHDYLRFYERK